MPTESYSAICGLQVLSLGAGFAIPVVCALTDLEVACKSARLPQAAANRTQARSHNGYAPLAREGNGYYPVSAWAISCSRTAFGPARSSTLSCIGPSGSWKRSCSM